MAKTKEMVKRPETFSSVRKAREALKTQAMEILTEYRTMIKQAAASGKFEAALEAQKWLLDHIPAEAKDRLFDQSIDKAGKEEGQAGPIVQIGFKLGGVKAPELIPEVIDIDQDK